MRLSYISLSVHVRHQGPAFKSPPLLLSIISYVFCFYPSPPPVLLSLLFIALLYQGIQLSFLQRSHHRSCLVSPTPRGYVRHALCSPTTYNKLWKSSHQAWSHYKTFSIIYCQVKITSFRLSVNYAFLVSFVKRYLTEAWTTEVCDNCYQCSC